MGTAKFYVHAATFEELFQIPEGYQIVGVEYRPDSQLLKFLLASEKLPESENPLEVALVMHTEHLAGHPEYRKFSGEIKLL